MNGRSRAFTLVVLLGFLVSTQSRGQALLSSEGTALVVVTQTAASAERDTLNKIAIESLVQDFERRGFNTSVVVSTGAGRADVVRSAIAASSAPLSRYAVSIVTETIRSTITIQLAWFDSNSDEPVAMVTQAGPTDLSLDRVVFSAVDQLLAKVGPIAADRQIPRSPSTPAAPENAARKDTVPKDTAVASGSAGAAGEAVAPASRAPSDSQPIGTAQPGPVQTLPATPAIRSAGLEIGFGAAPFIAAGDLSLFFRLSGNLQARLTYRLPGPAADVAVGILVAPVVFQVEGPLDSGYGLFLPIAAEFRLSGSRSVNTFSPYARIVGGAALLLVATGLDGTRTAYLPYFGGGVGVTRTFARGAGISLDVLTSIFLDGGDFIIGFNPGIEISFPLGASK